MTRAAALFGRDEELWAVRQALDGRGCVIAGPPGVGKSRLAADAAAGLGPDHTLIRVVASSAAGTIPFGAVSHLLLASSASTIVGIVAALRDGRLGPAPVLLVDDAHLLDDASAALVLAIATSGVAPLLVTLRTHEPAPDAVSMLWRDRHLERVDLQSLSAGEAELLVDELLGAPSHGLVYDWVQPTCCASTASSASTTEPPSPRCSAPTPDDARRYCVGRTQFGRVRPVEDGPWASPERAGSRGPQRSLRRDDIVAAALGLADEDGLGAVSMAKVAERVGVSTMALYRYVANKDELLVLVGDAALGPPPQFPRRRTWRANLAQWATAVRSAWIGRPWLLRITATASLSGPNNLAWLDAGLHALASTPLSAADRLDVVLLLSTYARGDAWLQFDVAALGDEADADESLGLGRSGAVASMLDAARYPALTAAIAAGAFEPRPGVGKDVEHFDVALEILLDGIERRIEERRTD